MLDPIADMLTRIRNAQRAGHEETAFPSSKVKKAILAVLKERGFIEDFSEEEAGKFSVLKVKLSYIEDNRTRRPRIKQLRRVSKEGQRIYVGKNDIRKVKNGLGVAVVSTSKGVVSGEKARQLGVGGELLCEVW